jgi:hypothetical protein
MQVKFVECGFDLNMKSVDNSLGYIREQFYRFFRGCNTLEDGISGQPKIIQNR